MPTTFRAAVYRTASAPLSAARPTINVQIHSVASEAQAVHVYLCVSMHMRKPVVPRSSKTRRTIAVALACLTFILVVSRAFSGVRRLTATSDSLSLTTSGKTLVVHIFADTDPEYLKNLRFFIQWGIDPNDDADYIVVVQNIPSKTVGCLSYTNTIFCFCLLCLYSHLLCRQGLCSYCDRLLFCLTYQRMLSMCNTIMSAMIGAHLVGCYSSLAMSN